MNYGYFVLIFTLLKVHVGKLFFFYEYQTELVTYTLSQLTAHVDTSLMFVRTNIKIEYS